MVGSGTKVRKMGVRARAPRRVVALLGNANALAIMSADRQRFGIAAARRRSMTLLRGTPLRAYRGGSGKCARKE